MWHYIIKPLWAWWLKGIFLIRANHFLSNLIWQFFKKGRNPYCRKKWKFQGFELSQIAKFVIFSHVFLAQCSQNVTYTNKYLRVAISRPCYRYKNWLLSEKFNTIIMKWVLLTNTLGYNTSYCSKYYISLFVLLNKDLKYCPQ